MAEAEAEAAAEWTTICGADVEVKSAEAREEEEEKGVSGQCHDDSVDKVRDALLATTVSISFPFYWWNGGGWIRRL